MRTVFHDVVSGLQDLDRVVVQHQPDAVLRDRLQLLEDQTVQRLRPVRRQMPVHHAIQGPDIGAGVDDEAPGLFPQHVLGFRFRFRRELTHDFLEDIFQRHDALDIPVFIYDEGDAPPIPLELHQLPVQRRGLGHEVGLLEQREKLAGTEIVQGRCLDQAAQVQHAADVVDVVAIDGQPCVTTVLDEMQSRLMAVVEIDADDFVVGHHHVVDGHVLQLQDAQEHLVTTAGQQRAGFTDQGAQFVDGQVVIIDILRVYAAQAQQAIGDEVDQPDHGPDDLLQRVIDVGRGQRHALGMQGRERLRCQFRENQDHQREQDGAGCDPQRAAELQRDVADQLGGGDIDDVIAQQDHADQAIRSFEELVCQLGAAMAVSGPMAEAVPIDAHQRSFGPGEKSR